MRKNVNKEKIIVAVVVIPCLVVAFLFFQKFTPESFMKKDQTVIGQREIQADASKSYTGKRPGEDILRISSAEEFEGSVEQYLTVSAKGVVQTGIYGLKPWVDPYSITKRRTSGGRMQSTGRRAQEATKLPAGNAEYYREYNLVQLEDGSYILAQFDSSYKKELRKGKTVLLPIGKKKTNSNEVRSSLQEICGQYGVDTTYTFYAVDDEWDQEHNFTLFMIRIGVAVLLFFVMSVGLILAARKIFRVD